MSEIERRDQLRQKVIDLHSNLNIDALLDAFSFLHDESSKAKYRGQQRVEVFSDRYQEVLKDLVNYRLSIKDFETIKVVGRGEFGEVRLVRCKVNGECYAMKLLNKCGITRRMDESRFFEERDVMARVESSFIVRMNYAFQDEVNLYIVMDFMPGGDLWQMLIDTAEDWCEDWTRFYMAELLIAIEDMHKAGYVHRDIKPENIMVDIEGHFRLTDFGSAGIIPEGGVLEKTSVAVGTPTYVAPEVLNIEPYTKSVDLFSFGCVLFETIMGASPFENDEEGGTIFDSNEKTKKLNYELPPPDDDLTYSDEYGDLVRKLLVGKSERLTLEQVKEHPFFKGIDWEAMRKKEIKPPHVPKVKGLYDADTYFNDVESDFTTVDKFQPTAEFSVDHMPFIGFSYNRYHYWGDSGSGAAAPEIVKQKGAPEPRTSGGGGDPAVIEQLEREIREYKSKLQGEEQKFAQQKREGGQALSKLALLEVELKQMESKYNATNRKLERMQNLRKNAIEKQQEELAEYEKTVKQSELDMRNAVKKLKEAEENIEEYKGKIIMLEDTIAKEKKLRGELSVQGANSKETEKEISDLQAELEKTKNSNSELINKQTELEKKNEVINTEIVDLTTKVDHLKASNKELEEAKTEMIEKSKELEENLETLKAEKLHSTEKSTSKIANFEAKIKELDATIEKQKATITEIDDAKNQLDQQIVKLTSELKYANDRHAQAKSSLAINKDDADKENQERAEKIKQLERELVDFRTEKNVSETELNQLKKKYQDATSAITELEASVSEKTAAVATLNEHLDELKNMSTQTQKKLAGKTIECTAMKAKVADTVEELSKAQDEKDEVIKMNKKLELDIQSEKATAINLQTTVEQLNEKVKELNSQISEKSNLLQGLQSDSSTKDSDNQKLLQELKDTNNELKKKYGAEITEAESTIAMLDLDKKDIERKLQVSEEHHKELKEEFEVAQEEIQEKQEKVVLLTTEKEKMIQENNELLVQLDHQKNRLEEEEQEKDVFQRQVYVIQAKLDQAVTKLAETTPATNPNPKPNTAKVDKRKIKTLETKLHTELAANKRLVEENQELKSKFETEEFDKEELRKCKEELEAEKKKCNELALKVDHLKMFGSGGNSALQGNLRIQKQQNNKRAGWKSIYAQVNSQFKKIYLYTEEPKTPMDQPYQIITIGHVFHARAATSAEASSFAKRDEVDTIFQIVYTKESSGLKDSSGHNLVESGKSLESCFSCNERMVFSKVFKCKDCHVKCHANIQSCIDKLKTKPCFGGLSGQSLFLRAKNVEEKNIWIETLTKIKNQPAEDAAKTDDNSSITSTDTKE